MLAEDDGGLGGGEIEFEDAPSGRGIALEIVDEEPPEIAGKSREDLLAELKAKDEAYAKEKAALEGKVDPIAALQSSFAALGERLEKSARPQVAPMPVVQQPTETPEQFAERIRTALLENPVGAIAEVGEKLYGPRIAQQAATISSLTKQLLMQQPEKKVIFERYGHEIEALAVTAPGNPNAFFEATEIIASRHMSEIATEQAKAMAATMFEEFKKQLGNGNGEVARGTGMHVESVPAKAPQRDAMGRRVFKVTPSQKATIEAEAYKRHMTTEQYIELYVDSDWQKEFR